MGEKIIILIICLGALIALFALGFKFFAPLFELKERNNHEYAMKQLIRDGGLDCKELLGEIKELQQRQDNFATLYADLNSKVNTLDDNKVNAKQLYCDLKDKINDELEDILERQERIELKVFNGIDVNAKPKSIVDFNNHENATNENVTNEDADW